MTDCKIIHLRDDSKRHSAKGGAITVLYTMKEHKDGFLFELRYALCNPKDNFSRKKGVKIAEAKDAHYHTLLPSTPTDTIYGPIFITTRTEEFESVLNVLCQALTVDGLYSKKWVREIIEQEWHKRETTISMYKFKNGDIIKFFFNWYTERENKSQ